TKKGQAIGLPSGNTQNYDFLRGREEELRFF
ncbi:MAG: hypothetical protein JWP63_5742, partial [Candidatus Solibacter sp.]|nr:hypothetical protein [Candidatus Solibacter sp.]